MKMFRSTMMCFPFWLLLTAGAFLAEFTSPTPTPSADSASAQKTDSQEGETHIWNQRNGRGFLICKCTIDPRYNTCVPGTVICHA